MTPPAPAAATGREPLPARVFRALFQHFDLYSLEGTHVAATRGTP